MVLNRISIRFDLVTLRLFFCGKEHITRILIHERGFTHANDKKTTQTICRTSWWRG